MEGREPKVGDSFLKGKRKNPLDDIVDKETLAIFLDCESKTVTRWQQEFSLPFIPIGRETYFSLKTVYEWMINQEIFVAEKEGQRRIILGKPVAFPQREQLKKKDMGKVSSEVEKSSK